MEGIKEEWKQEEEISLLYYFLKTYYGEGVAWFIRKNIVYSENSISTMDKFDRIFFSMYLLQITSLTNVSTLS